MEENTQNTGNYSQSLASWKFKEYEPHNRSNAWYLWFGIGCALLLGIAIFTQNFLFVVIILLSALILFLQNWKQPDEIDFKITTGGIEIGPTKISMRQIDQFWIVYQPPFVKKLYFHFESPLKPSIGIPLENQNPVEIRELLLAYIPENLDTEDEPTPDALARFFKL